MQATAVELPTLYQKSDSHHLAGSTESGECQALYQSVCSLYHLWKGNLTMVLKYFALTPLLNKAFLWAIVRTFLCEFPPMAPFIGCFSTGINIREESLKCFSNSLMEQEMATHSSILAWRISWTEEPGGLHSSSLKESDMTEQLTHTHIREWPQYQYY